MVELGQYSFAILMSYFSTFSLLALLLAMSIYRQRKIRKALNHIENNSHK